MQTSPVLAYDYASMVTFWKLAPAIAAGNTLIIKTPEIAPLYGQRLASLVKEAGFPPGVINILCGLGHIAGQALAEHPGIKKIAFTGSGPVGRRILKAAADSNLKKVTLELGGKGPSIVFPDADFDNAVFWTTLGITANNGQVCAAGSRIYVHESIYDKFLVTFGEKIVQTTHGDPLLPETTKGPVVSKQQREKIVSYIDGAKKANIRLLAGGHELPGGGNFVANTAFADVPDDAQIMQEEIFGPVAVSLRGFESIVIDFCYRKTLLLMQTLVHCQVQLRGLGRGKGQQHNVRAQRGHFHKRCQPRPEGCRDSRERPGDG